jgi:TrmH family RNA methyltransferase
MLIAPSVVPRPVTAFSNPVVRRLRALDDRKARREEGLFLAEGLRVAGEALDAGRAPSIVALTDEAARHPLGARIVAACEAAGGEAILVPRDLLAKITGKDNPAGCAAAFRLWQTGLERLDPRAAPLWLAAEGLRDPGNLGTMLRTCDAVGAGGLILLDQSADPFGVEAVRASMGAIFTVAVAQASFDRFIAWARDGGAQVAAAVLAEDAIDYRAASYRAPTVALMGNEQSGLTPAQAAAANLRVRMPMRGKADSLNVAVAAAVLLYAMLDQTARAA